MGIERIKKEGAVAIVDSSLPAVPEGWEDRFAKHVKDDHVAAVSSYDGWPIISTKGGVYTVLEASLGKKMEVVVLAAARENVLYEGSFNANKPSAPVCWAVAFDDDLAPSVKVPEPVHANCAECPNNKFGTAVVGRGKACKNYVKLAVVPYHDIEGQGYVVRIPPSGIAPWSRYVKKAILSLHRPIFSLVTQLSIEPKGGAFTVLPELVGFCNSSEELTILEARIKAAEDEVLREYEPREEDE